MAALQVLIHEILKERRFTRARFSDHMGVKKPVGIFDSDRVVSPLPSAVIGHEIPRRGAVRKDSFPRLGPVRLVLHEEYEGEV
jgi:hypothetical protein